MKHFLTALLLASTALSGVAQDKIYPNEFPLGDVTLLDGPLKHARDLNVEVLLKYDVDRLLAPFFKEAGLPLKAELFPNWAGLDGHVGGHYISALAFNAATGDERSRERLEYIISELTTVAEANAKTDWGKGYIGGVPGSANMWSTFKRGDLRAYNGAWVPFYNIHKTIAGLRDAWVYCGIEQAKTLYLGLCDWSIDIIKDLNEEQMARVLGMEHGGMNEVIADAYVITGDIKYLDGAKRFSHRYLLDNLSRRQDCLDNMHANTQVPKVVGFERIATLGGGEMYHNAGSFFWDIVTGERSLALGGNSRREHFPAKDACLDFVTDVDGPESCNTNNMMKLTEELHRRNPEARYADFYETAMFNHILSTQHPEHGGYVYFTSGRPRHYRNYSAVNEAMWCCVGTGMENHGKYGQFVYTHVEDALYVNLFAATELNWRERGIVLRQETSFPYAESSKLTIAQGKGEFKLMVRYPGWVKPGEFKVMVNGQEVKTVTGPSSYVCIDRKWKKGDVVDIQFPMHSSIKYLPNAPQYIALMHGPILLGMKAGTEDLRGLIADDSRFGQIASGKKLPVNEAPILINNDLESIADDLVPIPGKPLHFNIKTRMVNPIEGEIQPFFEIHDSRYMMYWLALTEGSYQQYLDNLAREEQERLALEARTTDKVQPGEQQPESDHFMETTNSWTGYTNNVAFRDARDGNSFSYLMQTQGETSLSLRLMYWGVGDWKTHEFDILIDDVVVKSINLTNKYKNSEWKYETYELPASVLEGKTQVRVKIQAHPHKQVGEVYEVRLVK